MFTSLLLIVTVLVIVGLAVWAVVALVRGNYRFGLQCGLAALIILGIYAIVLIGVGLASDQKQLALGELKCFDEWCGTILKVEPDSTKGAYTVFVQLSNKGRRPQAGSNPQLWIVTNHGRSLVATPLLNQRVSPQQPLDFHLTVKVPEGSVLEGFLLTEGGFPSRLVIGDENSPWHAVSTWPVSPSVAHPEVKNTP